MEVRRGGADELDVLAESYTCTDVAAKGRADRATLRELLSLEQRVQDRKRLCGDLPWAHTVQSKGSLVEWVKIKETTKI